MADKSLTVIFLLLVTFISSTTAENSYHKSTCPKKRPTDEPFGNHKQISLTIPKVVKTLDLGRADWKETQNKHVISVDIPGMKREDLKIEVEDNRVLRVSGERKGEEEINVEKWHRAKSISWILRGQFRLPGNADLEKIWAHIENGVLRIRVLKLREEKKKPNWVLSTVKNVFFGQKSRVISIA